VYVTASASDDDVRVFKCISGSISESSYIAGFNVSAPVPTGMNFEVQSYTSPGPPQPEPAGLQLPVRLPWRCIGCHGAALAAIIMMPYAPPVAVPLSLRLPVVTGSRAQQTLLVPLSFMIYQVLVRSTTTTSTTVTVLQLQ
jgi:hypothetical protein